MNKVQLIKTNKNKEMLCLNGYFYYLEMKRQKGTFNWTCSRRIPDKCSSRIITAMENNEHVLIRYPKKHTHEPIASAVEICRTNTFVKYAAINKPLNPSQIVQQSVVITNQKCRDYLPSKYAQKRKIGYTRNEMGVFREPQAIDEIDYPLNLYVLDNELFILAEEKVGDEYMVIFGTKSSIQLLQQSDCWLVDGTFDVVPTIMRQLFSVHGRIEREVVPLLFCLMSKKSAVLYEAFFKRVIQIALEYGVFLSLIVLYLTSKLVSCQQLENAFQIRRYEGAFSIFPRYCGAVFKKNGKNF